MAEVRIGRYVMNTDGTWRTSSPHGSRQPRPCERPGCTGVVTIARVANGARFCSDACRHAMRPRKPRVRQRKTGVRRVARSPLATEMANLRWSGVRRVEAE